nr:MAG TPA: head tail attachment [Caudoviricetes sp.]
MGNVLAQAGRWLADMRGKFLTEPVRYVTKSGKVYKVRATVGATTFTVPDDHGILIRTQSRDFLITQLVLPHTPEFGDFIVWRGGMYEVLAPEGRCVWRWSDLFHTTKRIHTKYFREATCDDDTENETEAVACCPCRKECCHGKNQKRCHCAGTVECAFPCAR